MALSLHVPGAGFDKPYDIPHWTYHINSAKLYTPQGQEFQSKGRRTYSGYQEWRNDAGKQMMKNRGAIPEGWYRMTKILDDLHGTGLASIVLEPTRGTITFSRSGFRIHGDNHSNDYSASHGCIIFGNSALRHRIWDSGVRLLKVEK